ncbi:MAG: hydroxymethylbilane synthase [Euzebyaceae bacterium]|nr:hydroxymethylbilane synthase [Euzebyaceae bacterium]
MVRIATRRSALAQAQAFQTARLIARRAGAQVELVPMATTGDLHPDRAVGDFETKGLFVDTIRRAVLDGDCDLAVHSYKDLPTEPVPGLTIAAVPPREDPRDVLITRSGYALATLPATATVGTSSERRRMQLLRAKPGLSVLPVRGNLDTRLRKVADGEFDAAVVAMAGLKRLYAPEEAGGVGALGLPLTAAPLEPGECLSAAGQGALAVECRAGDEDALAVCRAIDDPPSARAVRAERAFLDRLGGGCLAPVGALCTVTAVGGLELAGMLADPVHRRVLRLSAHGGYDEPEALGDRLVTDLLAAGGGELLDSIAKVRARATHPPGEAAH